MPSPGFSESGSRVSSSFTTYNYGGTFYGPYPGPDRANMAYVRYKPPTVVNPPANGWGLRAVSVWGRISRAYSYGSVGVAHELIPGYPGGAYSYQSNGSALALGQPGIGGFQDELWGRAINGALSRLKDQRVNLGVAFGEGKRTKNLIVDAAQRFERGVRKFAELKRGKIWKEVKASIPGISELPEEWLRFIYGFSPVLSDVEGAAEAFAKMMEGGNPFHIRVSKTVSSSESRQDVWGDSNGQFVRLSWGDCPLIMDLTIDETAQAYFYYAMNCDAIATFASLGLTNPASVAYELLPWSFALDWLLPVGNWIDLLDADFGWSYLDGGVTRTKKVKGKGLYFQGQSHDTWFYSGSPSDLRLNLYEMNRSKFVGAPWPVFPGLRNPFKSGNQTERTATQVSLVAQKLSKL